MRRTAPRRRITLPTALGFVKPRFVRALGVSAVVILDAVTRGAPPGTVHVLQGENVLTAGGGDKSSAHEIGAAQLLRAAALLGQLPPHLAVVGVEPETVNTGIGLSQAVSAALRPAAAAAAELIDEFVRRFGPKTASV